MRSASSVRLLTRGAMPFIAALALVACQTPGSSSSAGATATSTGSATASASTSAASPSASGSATAACLDADTMAAIRDIGGGDMDTDPSLTEVADALDGLELDGAGADARDAAVMRLREDPPAESFVVTALMQLRAEVALPEC